VDLVFESPTKCMHIVYVNESEANIIAFSWSKEIYMKNMHHERTSVAFLHTNQTM
jgi:hypothetical protein